MANYSIRDLEKLSGIKAHTIRIWEQRYNIIEPKRTATNIRFYTDEDLQYLLNVAFLNRNGIRISKISKMSKVDISDMVSSISQDSEESTNYLQTLTMAMIELNEEKFEHLVHTTIEKDGFEKTVIELLVPFLEKLSLLWLTGSINSVHEQFINNLIRQKIVAHIDMLPLAKATGDKPRAVLFEPIGEAQEVLLSLINYFLRSRGCQTLYLGNNIAISDIEVAIELFNPNCIVTAISDNNKKSPADFLTELSELYPTMQVIASAQSVARKMLLPDNVAVFEDFNEFLELVDELDNAGEQG